MRSSRYQLVKDLAQWQSKEKHEKTLTDDYLPGGLRDDISLRRSEAGKILVFTRDQRVGSQARSLPALGRYPSQCVRREIGWTSITPTSHRCEVGGWR